MKQAISIQPDVLSQTVDKEAVLLDLKNELYYGLNEVGARIWQLLQEDNSLEQIKEVLLEEYDVDETLLQKDLDTLVSALKQADLIRAG